MHIVATPTKTRAIVQEKGFRPHKSRGQNFLIDANIVRKIAEAASLSPQDTVVEIGPGLGALTQELAEQAGKVIAIEIDRRLMATLRETLADKDNVRLVEADALKIDFDRLVGEHSGKIEGGLPTYKVVANLPYYITTPLLMHLLENRFKIDKMVVMVQAEVGRRMLAAPGSKDYGSLSVAVQYYMQPTFAFKVPPSVFYPRPKVNSLVLKLNARDRPLIENIDEELFFLIVRTAFNQRRKMLVNALTNMGINRMVLLKALKEAGIDPRCRGETLNIRQFAALALVLQQQWERRR